MSRYKGMRAISLFVGVLLCMALTGNTFAAWNMPDITNWNATTGNATTGNSTVQNTTSENTTIWNSTNSSVSPSDIMNIWKLADLIKFSIPGNGT